MLLPGSSSVPWPLQPPPPQSFLGPPLGPWSLSSCSASNPTVPHPLFSLSPDPSTQAEGVASLLDNQGGSSSLGTGSGECWRSLAMSAGKGRSGNHAPSPTVAHQGVWKTCCRLQAPDPPSSVERGLQADKFPITHSLADGYPGTHGDRLLRPRVTYSLSDTPTPRMPGD